MRITTWEFYESKTHRESKISNLPNKLQAILQQTFDYFLIQQNYHPDENI